MSFLAPLRGTGPGLAGSSPRKRTVLAELLGDELTRYSATLDPEVFAATEEKLEQLKSLGYVQ